MQRFQVCPVPEGALANCSTARQPELEKCGELEVGVPKKSPDSAMQLTYVILNNLFPSLALNFLICKTKGWIRGF